jgi:hypothetical protein
MASISAEGVERRVRDSHTHTHTHTHTQPSPYLTFLTPFVLFFFLLLFFPLSGLHRQGHPRALGGVRTPKDPAHSNATTHTCVPFVLFPLSFFSNRIFFLCMKAFCCRFLSLLCFLLLRSHILCCESKERKTINKHCSKHCSQQYYQQHHVVTEDNQKRGKGRIRLKAQDPLSNSRSLCACHPHLYHTILAACLLSNAGRV